MNKLKRDFMLRNGLYKWGDKISVTEYEKFPPDKKLEYEWMENNADTCNYRLPGNQQEYEPQNKGGTWCYRQIIPQELTAEKIAELCALEQAENAAKSEKHLRTIKNIIIFLLALDVVSALIMLVSNFIR